MFIKIRGSIILQLYDIETSRTSGGNKRSRDVFLRNVDELLADNGTLQPHKVVLRPRHSSGGYSPASHRDGPGSNPGLVMWDFVMDKSGAGAGFLSANLHSICFSTIIFTFTRGWHNRPGVAAVPIASQTRILR
jgi:hypothetical protein